MFSLPGLEKDISLFKAEDRIKLHKLITLQKELGENVQIPEFLADDRCTDLEYRNGKASAEFAKDLFIEVLNFDDTESFFNLRKSEVIEKLE